MSLIPTRVLLLSFGGTVTAYLTLQRPDSSEPLISKQFSRILVRSSSRAMKVMLFLSGYAEGRIIIIITQNTDVVNVFPH